MVPGAAPAVPLHGLGAGSELPFEPWQLVYVAAAVLLLTLVWLRATWAQPRLEVAAAGGRTVGVAVPGAVGALARIVVVVLLAATVAAAWVGPDDITRNLAPVAVYVAFFAMVPVLSAVLGPFWRAVDPLDSLATVVGRLSPPFREAPGVLATHWPASVGLLSFAWLALAYDRPSSTEAIAIWLTAYVVVHVAAAGVFGRAWLQTGEGFGVLFGLLAGLAPVAVDEGDDGARRLRLRWPIAGAATVEVRAGSLAVVAVAVGSGFFDGIVGTQRWGDIVGDRTGWAATAVRSVGLALTIALVAVVLLVAARLTDRLAKADEHPDHVRRWVPALLVVALALAVAHAAPLVADQLDAFVALLSDPWDAGWNLFGTAQPAGDLLPGGDPPSWVAWVEVVALIAGHAAALVVVHDRAVANYGPRRAASGEVPLVIAAWASAVGCLLLFA